MQDFSSMSAEEKKGYLKALGIDPWEMGSASAEHDDEDNSVSVVSINQSKFSDEELSLLQKGSARVQGALSTIFATVLRSSLVDMEVDKEVTVKIKPFASRVRLDRLRVREAIKVGLEPFL